MKIIKLDQRSNEWLEWRKGGIGASETAQILGKSPFGSAQKLWEVKTGRRAPDKMNPAMLKGQLDEPAALAAYEELTGELMVSDCAEHDTHSFIRASFDGIRVDGTKALEIKCPGVKTHQMAINGVIPEYYLIQMHQQMLVADLQEIDYFSYFKEWPEDSKRGVLITVKRSELLINEIITATADFWEHIQNDTPMYVEGWEHAAAYWLAIQDEVDYLKELEANAKEALLMLAEGHNMQGSGVSLTIAERKGSIDYKTACTDKGLSDEDLISYRKDGSMTTTIRRLKHSPVVEVAPVAITISVVDQETAGAWSW